MSDIGELVRSAEIKPFIGVVYRFHNPKWAFAPTSGEGASLTGGRFNPVGMSAFYASLEQQTAFVEVSTGASRKIIDPMILCAYEANIDRVIDFSNHGNVFNDEWRLLNLQSKLSKGQQVATYNQEYDMFDAAIVPSAVRRGFQNIVIFNWSKDSLSLHDPEGRLPSLFMENYKD